MSSLGLIACRYFVHYLCISCTLLRATNADTLIILLEYLNFVAVLFVLFRKVYKQKCIHEKA